MENHTQWRIALPDGGTRWYDTLEEAQASRWLQEPGAVLVTRPHPDATTAKSATVPPVVAKNAPTARIIAGSRYEVMALCRQAMKNGKAFAAQPAGPGKYRVMTL